MASTSATGSPGLTPRSSAAREQTRTFAPRAA